VRDSDALSYRWPLALILLLAILVRVIGLTFCLPLAQCRPDETTIGAVATGFYRGNFNSHFFNYPPLFMWAVSLCLWTWLEIGQLLGYLQEPAAIDALVNTTTLHLIARILSAALGAATVWILYRVALRVFDDSTALVAAFFLAVAFLHVRDSHFGVTDVPATFMALLAFAAILRIPRRGLTATLIAGIATGAAAATKYNVALIAVAGVVAILFPAEPRSFQERMSGVAAYVSATILTFFCIAPYSLVDWPHFISALQYESAHLAAGHGHATARGWHVHLMTNLRFGLGLPLLVASLGGLVHLIARRPRTGALAAVFPVAYYAVLGHGYTVFARYALPLVPFLCLFAGYGTVQLTNRLLAVRRLAQPNVALAALSVIIALPSVLSAAAFDRLISRTDNRTIARRWLERTFRPGTTIIQLGPESAHLFIEPDPELSGHFVDRSPANGELAADVVIVPDSELFESPPSAEFSTTLSSGPFVVAADFVAAAPSPRRVYDWQDEFYIPLSGFDGVSRPGPNYKIYVRRDGPSLPSNHS